MYVQQMLQNGFIGNNYTTYCINMKWIFLDHVHIIILQLAETKHSYSPKDLELLIV